MGLRLPLAAAGLVVALLGAWFFTQATQLRAGPGYAAVGPRVFPMMVGGGLVAAGLGVLLGQLRSRRAAVEVPEELAVPPDWVTLGTVAALLAAYVALFEPLGFVLSSAVFLPACAWALGSRSPVRDILAGVGVAVVAYVVFTWLLGLELPEGPLARLFP